MVDMYANTTFLENVRNVRTLFGQRSPMAYGSWLKLERDGRGWTQEYLAELADTTKATIQRLEYGQRNPSRKMAMGISRALASTEGSEAEKQLAYDRGMIAAGFDTTAVNGGEGIVLPTRLAPNIEIVVDTREGPRRGTLTEQTLRAIAELLEPVEADAKA